MSQSDLDRAANHNFILYGSDTWISVLTFESQTTGAPVDLTGSIVTLTIKAKRGDTAVVKALTIGSGLALTTSNQITLTTNASDIPPGTYVYDMTFVKDGITTTYLKGSVIKHPGV